MKLNLLHSTSLKTIFNKKGQSSIEGLISLVSLLLAFLGPLYLFFIIWAKIWISHLAYEACIKSYYKDPAITSKTRRSIKKGLPMGQITQLKIKNYSSTSEATIKWNYNNHAFVSIKKTCKPTIK